MLKQIIQIANYFTEITKVWNNLNLLHSITYLMEVYVLPGSSKSLELPFSLLVTPKMFGTFNMPKKVPNQHI